MAGHTLWTHAFEPESSDWVVWGSVSEPDETGMTFQSAICTLSDSCDENEARLIAAAPDLLEALMMAEADIAAWEDEFSKLSKPSNVLAVVRAAIAKAAQP